MNSTASPKALLPHEMNEVDRRFSEIVNELGLPRDCAAAESIAARILGHYQRGLRDLAVLKDAIGISLRSGADETSDVARDQIAVVSVEEVAGGPDSQISPEDLQMLQRTLDRMCVWCSIPRYGKRADRLARYLTERFRSGRYDGTSLFEIAVWLEQHSSDTAYRWDA
ncbi:hypothetical protein LAC81_35205 (plasmid) [Ensifer adhaerens]|uniref:hypothetical protein n=1 Tax=Ensifer adhaerens TaxID=106592 RepID=UPI001CBB0143|nr:hypothetical protein [Ensifer adhaerens]MBZ7927194.1 hypothetical protein [Ensifer adhaerens]UAX98227.1 hypothetical protein LAC78_36505 [Ensifer adhaerens]UAY05609.1 hypothetical protein LAC80_35210 [Ensifer adhaerens]UAY12987.1 hypothetical protein LAC81_35205 [Ensifer adhaerens]